MFKDELLIYETAIRGENNQSSFQKISDKPLKIAFRNIIFNKLNPKNWRDEKVHSDKDAFFYFEENDLVDVSNKSLGEIAARNLQNVAVRRLSINFSGSRYQDLENIPIFKNSEESEPIPVDCCDSVEILEKWIGNIAIPATNFLRNKDRFEPTSKIAPKVKTKIYKEISTGYFWYFDNFHATEFEVYDAQGKQIGVADLEGNLDRDGAEPGRSISNVL